MGAYQAILDAIDAKLAEPLTMEDKSNLEDAIKAQSDVGPTLTDIAALVTAPGYTGSSDLKSAYSTFKQLREAEIKAAAAVDSACPDDLE